MATNGRNKHYVESSRLLRIQIGTEFASHTTVLFNSKQKIESVAELDENQLEPINFTRILENSFVRIEKDNNHRVIIGTDFTIDFFADNEHSSNFMLSLYGENGIYALIELAKKHNWQIYDSGIDGMVDLKSRKERI